MPSPKHYHLDEISGHDFASLPAARCGATDLLADLLTQKIHAMLKQGDLTVENGIILPVKGRKGL